MNQYQIINSEIKKTNPREIHFLILNKKKEIEDLKFWTPLVKKFLDYYYMFLNVDESRKFWFDKFLSAFIRLKISAENIVNPNCLFHRKFNYIIDEKHEYYLLPGRFIDEMYFHYRIILFFFNATLQQIEVFTYEFHHDRAPLEIRLCIRRMRERKKFNNENQDYFEENPQILII